MNSLKPGALLRRERTQLARSALQASKSTIHSHAKNSKNSRIKAEVNSKVDGQNALLKVCIETCTVSTVDLLGVARTRML